MQLVLRHEVVNGAIVSDRQFDERKTALLDELCTPKMKAVIEADGQEQVEMWYLMGLIYARRLGIRSFDISADIDSSGGSSRIE